MDNTTGVSFDSFLYHEYPEIVPADTASMRFLDEQARFICKSLGLQRSVYMFQAMSEYGSLEFSNEISGSQQNITVNLYDTTPEYSEVIAYVNINSAQNDMQVFTNKDVGSLAASAIDSLVKNELFSDIHLSTLLQISRIFDATDFSAKRLTKATHQYKANLANNLSDLINYYAVTYLEKQQYQLSDNVSTLEIDRFLLKELQNGNDIDVDALHIAYKNDVDAIEFKYYKDENDCRSLEVNRIVTDQNEKVIRNYNNFSVKHISFLSKLLLDVHVRDLQNT